MVFPGSPCVLQVRVQWNNEEATTGFEPVIRVLQTLAFPLGHVALGV